MEEEYSKLQKEHDLPKLELLDKYFQVSNIEEKKFLLKEITKKIHEKTHLFSSVLEDILSPEMISSSYESSLFSDEEKKEILKLYKKLQFFNREYLMLEISYDEKNQVEFIKEVMTQWENTTLELKKIVSKMKHSWNNDKKTKLELGYFG